MRKWLLAGFCLIPAAVWGQPLPDGKWDPYNRARLNALVEQVGRSNPDYSEHHPPYAVLDWDNTSIFLDVQEATITYQLTHLCFAAMPQQLDQAIRTGVPAQPFAPAFNNDAGHSVDIGALAADIGVSYSWLYHHYQGLAGKESFEEVQRSPHYSNFTVKMRYLYDAIDGTFHTPVSHPWLTYFFVGMTRDQVQALTRQAVRAELSSRIGKVIWYSPEELPGRAGVVSVTFRRGLRLVPEMQQLYAVLLRNGIEPWVCSASFVDVVEEMAGNPEFGYNLPPGRVLALELERDTEGKILAQPRAGFEQTFGSGKTLAIRRRLVSRYGYDPVLLAGDSQGDENMLVDFTGLKLGLIFNLWRSPDKLIGGLSRRAVAEHGKAGAVYLLQGRDDNNGCLWPGQGRIPLRGYESKVFP